MKYSIIIPVWNTEEYLEKCFESILNQSYHNYEVIIVNDGSTDYSDIIIDKYCKLDNRFLSYYKEHSGPADTRNVGISQVTGDYILFLDSDDYFELNLIKTINDINTGQDIIKYGCQLVNQDGTILKKYKTNHFQNKNMIDALKTIVTDELIDSFCIYAFKRDFFTINKFLCQSGRLHEDFGTISYILLKAKEIISIDYIGLNYVKRENSITNNHSREMEMKKALDTIEQYSVLVKQIIMEKEEQEKKNIMIIFITDSVIRKYDSLEKSMKKNYKKIIKGEKIYKNLPTNSFKRWIKKYGCMLDINFYLFLTNLGRKK